MKIAGTGSYVPERILTNAELEKLVDTTDEWIVSRTGIHERRIAAPGEATSHMATKAAQRAIEAAGITAGDIDLIIVATITPDTFFPSTACHVQRNLGAVKAVAFDVSAACAGFLYASLDRSRRTSPLALPLLIFSLYVVLFRIVVRPHVFSLVCVSALVFAMERWRRSRRLRDLVWLAPVQVL